MACGATEGRRGRRWRRRSTTRAVLTEIESSLVAGRAQGRDGTGRVSTATTATRSSGESARGTNAAAAETHLIQDVRGERHGRRRPLRIGLSCLRMRVACCCERGRCLLALRGLSWVETSPTQQDSLRIRVSPRMQVGRESCL